MNLLRTAFWLVLWFGCSACSLAAAGKGDTCVRSTECAVGLACVQGKCGTDLSSIARQSKVPDLGQGSDAALRDAGRADAARPVAPNDGAAAAPTRDAAQPGRDAG